MPILEAAITTLLLAGLAAQQEHVFFPTEGGGVVHATVYGHGAPG
jgi:hypothetical protein